MFWQILKSKFSYLAVGVLIIMSFAIGYFSRPYLQFSLFSQKAVPGISVEKEGERQIKTSELFEEITVSQAGRATILSIERKTSAIFVNLQNPSYTGDPRMVREVERKRKLVAGENLKVLSLQFQPSLPEERANPMWRPKASVKQGSFDDLKEGMLIYFVASDDFDFYQDEPISAKEISYEIFK